jgi:hypothetical protein
MCGMIKGKLINMGYRGKLITEHTSIELTKDFVEKHKDKYNIECSNGVYRLNISSKSELKGHHEILFDLEDIADEEDYSIWAAILWEDGRIDRFNLNTGYEDTLEAKDD